MLSFLSRGARTFGLPTPLTPSNSARCGARFRRHPKTAPLPSGILPHIAAECCPTSNGISAPLPRESAWRKRFAQHGRSEEHTSELQSPCNLVCRLLLEKKKTIRTSLLFYQNRK